MRIPTHDSPIYDARPDVPEEADPESEEDERKTGHDLHFLKRLSRTEADVADRALRLYRDPVLVREIINRALAEEAVTARATGASEAHADAAGGVAENPDDERFALELAPGPVPPCVIVTRKGVFVTCLGEGMGRSARHIIRAETVARAVRADNALDALRVRLDSGAYQELTRPIFRAGFRMTREHFLALRPLSPVLHATFTGQMLEAVEHLVTFARRAASRKRRLQPRDPILHGVWREYHATCHMIVLATCGEEEALDAWFGPLNKGANMYTHYFTYLTIMASGPLAIRALWATGLAGHRALPHVRAAFLETDSFFSWRAAALALLFIGARHTALREEARDTLAQRAVFPSDKEPYRIHGRALMDMVSWALRTDTDLTVAEALGFRAWGGEWAESSRRARSLCDEHGLSTLGFARRLLVNLESSLNNLDDLRCLLRGLPFVAAMSPQDFFHPADQANLIEEGYEQDHAIRIQQLYAPPEEPVRAEPRPGRNDKCPCGSGKKYKKCCEGKGVKAAGEG